MDSPTPTKARTSKTGQSNANGFIIAKSPPPLLPVLSTTSNTLIIESAAVGVSKVATDHRARPPARTIRGDATDKSKPAGTMPSPYPTLKSDEMEPLMVSGKNDTSCAMDTIATDMATRSRADTAATIHSRPKTT